jgi:hypothetical protein
MCDEVGLKKSLLAVTRHKPLRSVRLRVALPATGMVRASLLAPDSRLLAAIQPPSSKASPFFSCIQPLPTK